MSQEEMTAAEKIAGSIFGCLFRLIGSLAMGLSVLIFGIAVLLWLMDGENHLFTLADLSDSIPTPKIWALAKICHFIYTIPVAYGGFGVGLISDWIGKTIHDDIQKATPPFSAEDLAAEHERIRRAIGMPESH